MDWTIRVDDLTDRRVINLVNLHFRMMKEGSPEESMHALNHESLKADDLTFWTLWIDDEPAGCGALKELDSQKGELKSMRTHPSFLRKGVAQKILLHIMGEAKSRGYGELYLETGSSESFKPAHNLYRNNGFIDCAPFASYREDGNSLFMKRDM